MSDIGLRELRPTRGRAWLEICGTEESTPGGIIIPQMDEERPQRLLKAKVLGLGPPALTTRGVAVEWPIKVGDDVVYSAYNADCVTTRNIRPVEAQPGDRVLVEQKHLWAVVE